LHLAVLSYAAIGEFGRIGQFDTQFISNCTTGTFTMAHKQNKYISPKEHAAISKPADYKNVSICNT